MYTLKIKGNVKLSVYIISSMFFLHNAYGGRVGATKVSSKAVGVQVRAVFEAEFHNCLCQIALKNPYP